MNAVVRHLAEAATCCNPGSAPYLVGMGLVWKYNEDMQGHMFHKALSFGTFHSESHQFPDVAKRLHD